MRLFASDIHLCESAPNRTAAFESFLTGEARRASYLYLLGDIFDAWVGDDDDSSAARVVRAALTGLADAGVQVLIQRGNRDFLLGRRFCREAGCSLLPDLSILDADGRRILLAHGDLFCDDPAYLRWRRFAHGPVLPALSRMLPMFAKRRIAGAMRGRSKQRRQPAAVHLPVAVAEMRRHGCDILIHGHTHAPGEEAWQDGGDRFVRHCLPDWEASPGFVRLGDGGKMEYVSL